MQYYLSNMRILFQQKIHHNLSTLTYALVIPYQKKILTNSYH